MNDEIFHENLGALDKGVLIPGCNIKDELSKMSEEDARTAKRKWRKLMSASKKKLKNSWPPAPLTKQAIKRRARASLRESGKKLLGKK